MASAIEPIQKKQAIENPKQREAFLIYFELGGERSLVRVQQELSKKGTKISETSLAKWSKRHSWVERVQKMDIEVSEQTEAIAIKEATAKKSDILKAVKNTMIVYNRNLMAGSLVPSASDFKKMWEVMRIELGRNIGDGQQQEIPTINIAIVKNEKIIKIIKQAQDDFKKVLEAEILEND